MIQARQIAITDDNRGPLVNITAWIGIVVACIAVIVKISTKFFKARRLQADDYCIIAATVFAVAQTVTTNIEVAAGLGRDWNTLTESQRDRLQKAAYTSGLLYVSVLCSARLCVLAFFQVPFYLGHYVFRSSIIRVTMLAVVLWGLVSMLVITLQCPTSRLWAIYSGRCIRQHTFWKAEGAIDLFLDTFLAVLPIYLVHDIRLPLRKRITLMAAFGARIVTVPFIILRLVEASRNHPTTNPSSDNVGQTIATLVHMNVSIAASCIPFLKTFVDTLQTGLLSSDLHTITSGASHDRYKLKRWGYSRSESGSYPARHRDTDRRPWEEDPSGNTEWTVNITRGSGVVDIPTQARSGTTSEEALVIQQTMTTTVEIEENSHREMKL